MEEESSSFVRGDQESAPQPRKSPYTRKSNDRCREVRAAMVACLLLGILFFFSIILLPIISQTSSLDNESEKPTLPPAIATSVGTGHDPDLEGIGGPITVDPETSAPVASRNGDHNQDEQHEGSKPGENGQKSSGLGDPTFGSANISADWPGLSNEKIPTIEEPFEPRKDEQYFMDYFTKDHWSRWEEECNLRLLDVKPGRYMKKMWEADCGGGYKLPKDEAKDKKWKVGLVGSHWNKGIEYLSGCHVGFTCPLSPNCEIAHVSSLDHVQHVNVFLTVAMDHHLMTYLRRPPNTISVLYWREALWSNVPPQPQQKVEFDLEMGVHHFAGLKNPAFMRPPSFLLQGVHMDVKKTEFAASVISDCHTKSYREHYIERLVHALGEHRVHRYGKCGNRDFPGKPIIRGMRILASYLSFENTIERGYTTEKLFELMMLSTVPVYYGDPKAPNITNTPSYIRATDFSSPADLATYLLYLDGHPDEYEKYTSWRKLPEPFTDEYLEEAKHFRALRNGKYTRLNLSG